MLTPLLKRSMVLPTQDTELNHRLIRMFQNTFDAWKLTNSRLEESERYKNAVTQILQEVERRGYRKDKTMPSSYELSEM